MRVVFMGSPPFAVPSLLALHGAARHVVVAVVSQPGRPQGRGRRPAPSAVERAALDLDLPVLTPERLRGEFAAELRALGADVLAVVAYGKLLPAEVLAASARGAVNVHPSLLPRYRGAAPIQHAILNGDRETGVTTMLLDEGMDSGGILLQEHAAIGPEEDAAELAERLAEVGAGLLVQTLDQLEDGILVPRPQDPALVTHAPKLSAEDAWLDWSRPAPLLLRQVRGLTPWPTAQTTLADGRRVKVLAARVAAGAGTPGTVLAAAAARVIVACGGGGLEILRAQVEGRRPGTAQDLVNGRALGVGDLLGAR